MRGEGPTPQTQQQQSPDSQSIDDRQFPPIKKAGQRHLDPHDGTVWVARVRRGKLVWEMDDHW